MTFLPLFSPNPTPPEKSLRKRTPSGMARPRAAGFVLLLALLGAALLSPGCSRPNEKELSDAETAYQQKEYNRALALSDAVLQKDPSSLPAHRVKVLASLAQGSIEEAFEDYDSVERKYPEIAPQLLREIAVGTIQRSLGHENYFVRSAAVKAIGEMGDPELSPLIIPGLRDTAPFVRFFTVESVGLLGGPDALKLLLAAGKDPDGMVRVAVVKALDDMADNKEAGTGGIEINNVLATFMDDSDVTVRLFSLAGMARRGDEKAFGQLVEAVRALEPQARAAGAAALGRSKNKAAAPILIGLIGDADGMLRMYAAEAMGEIAVPEFYNPLANALADSDPGVRGAAATSLGKVGDKRAIPLLTKAITDPDMIVRVSAAEGLLRLGKKESAVYQAALAEKDYAIRHFTVGSLRKVGGKEDLPLLSKAAKDEAPRVRIAAIRAIGEVAGPEALPLLKESLKDPDLSVRTYAAGNVGRVLNKAAGKKLKKGV